MSTIFLYVRESSHRGTIVSQMDRREAVGVMRKYRKSKYQIGILSAKSIDSLKRVYGEFAPFEEIESKESIIDILDEAKNFPLRKIKELIDINISDYKDKILSEEAYTSSVYEDIISDNEINIVDKFPYAFIARRGLVPQVRKRGLNGKKEKVINLREYFADNNICRVTDFSVACRSQEKVHNSEYCLVSWLREGQLKADKIKTDVFDKEKLESSIKSLRKLTFKEQSVFHYNLVDILSKCGIAFVLVEKYPNTNVVGATQWDTNGHKAIIQLNLKGKRSDSLWFTLFHEIAHILKHDSKDFHLTMDDDKILEDEADELACSLLIPHEDFFRFKRRGNFSIGEIIKFSQEVNIHPSIVIGRLQHEGIIGWNMYNDYKIKVDII